MHIAFQYILFLFIFFSCSLTTLTLCWLWGLADTRWMMLVAWHSSSHPGACRGEACLLSKGTLSSTTCPIGCRTPCPDSVWWALLGKKTDGLSRKLWRMIKARLSFPILLSEALQCCLELLWPGLLQDFLPQWKQLPSSSPLGRINTTDLESS